MYRLPHHTNRGEYATPRYESRCFSSSPPPSTAVFHQLPSLSSVLTQVNIVHTKKNTIAEEKEEEEQEEKDKLVKKDPWVYQKQKEGEYRHHQYTPLSFLPHRRHRHEPTVYDRVHTELYRTLTPMDERYPKYKKSYDLEEEEAEKYHIRYYNYHNHRTFPHHYTPPHQGGFRRHHQQLYEHVDRSRIHPYHQVHHHHHQPTYSIPTTSSYPPSRQRTSRYLKETDRLEILERIKNGERQADLAKEFQVSRAAISNLKHRRFQKEQQLIEECKKKV